MATAPERAPGRDPGRATTILVLGILGLVCCPLLGIAAWVMGAGDLKRIDRGEITPEARTMTMAGMVCGIIATVLLVLGVIGWILAIAGAIMLPGM